MFSATLFNFMFTGLVSFGNPPKTAGSPPSPPCPTDKVVFPPKLSSFVQDLCVKVIETDCFTFLTSASSQILGRYLKFELCELSTDSQKMTSVNTVVAVATTSTAALIWWVGGGGGGEGGITEKSEPVSVGNIRKTRDSISTKPSKISITAIIV